MSKKIKFYILFFSILITTNIVKSQDANFSQFYANYLYLNPALTGNRSNPTLSLNYRNQWPALSNSFVNYHASYDCYFDKLRSGIGVSFLGDNAGDGTLKTNIVSGFYSYHLQISNSIFINAGFEASYYQAKLDWDKLEFADQFDPRYGFVLPSNEIQPANLSKSFVDFSSGCFIGISQKYFIGFSINHLTQPNNSFYNNSDSKLQTKITVHAGTIINISDIGNSSPGFEDITIHPNILYQQQGEFKQINLGMYLKKHPFVTGLWFRHNMSNSDALIILIGIEQKTYTVGYSYDFTVSKLKNINTGGGHEISFSYKFPEFPARRKRIRARDMEVPPF
ncbi:MAG: type IX secretion system membrane protein PorP/SprF [Bacteroidales bacterium]|nr:type IX secretion system membrane protein PorP/SprF [Bacteroidales bacterium]